MRSEVTKDSIRRREPLRGSLEEVAEDSLPSLKSSLRRTRKRQRRRNGGGDGDGHLHRFCCGGEDSSPRRNSSSSTLTTTVILGLTAVMMMATTASSMLGGVAMVPSRVIGTARRSTAFGTILVSGFSSQWRAPQGGRRLEQATRRTSFAGLAEKTVSRTATTSCGTGSVYMTAPTSSSVKSAAVGNGVSISSSTATPAEMASCETGCDRIFDLELPEGRCVGFQLKKGLAPDDPLNLSPEAIASNPRHWIRSLLHPDEIEYGMSLPSENGRRSFLIGRLAIRDALGLVAPPRPPPLDLSKPSAKTTVTTEADKALEPTTPPPLEAERICILKDEHGRPNLPLGFLGSISHKGTTAVALVTEYKDSVQGVGEPVLGIGVDIENRASNKGSIARKVLTPNEIEDLGNVEGVTSDDEVLLRFSLKESLYKAMHPLICQYVGFQEVEIRPLSDGRADVLFQLHSGAHEKFGTVTLHWRKLGDFFLSSASVRLREGTNGEER